MYTIRPVYAAYEAIIAYTCSLSVCVQAYSIRVSVHACRYIIIIILL